MLMITSLILTLLREKIKFVHNEDYWPNPFRIIGLTLLRLLAYQTAHNNYVDI